MNYRESGSFYNEREANEAVQRYENMLRKGATLYFDVFQIEQIIEQYLDEGKFHPALEAIEMGLEQHPGSIALKVRRVNILFNLGEIEKSLKLSNELLKIEKNNPELHLIKGSALQLLGKTNEAKKSFDLTLQYSDDERDEALFNIGYAYEQTNNFSTAIKYLEQAILENPMHEGALYELAYCYERTNQDEKSLKYYNKYIDLDTFSDSAWFNLGIVYTKLNRIEESIEAYDYALVINEDFPNAWFNMGHSQMILRKFNEAIESFTDYLKYDENNDEVLALIAHCHTRLKNYEKAIFFYQQALYANEENDRAWYGYALLQYAQKNYRKAYANLLKATKYNDTIFDYYLLLAKSAAKLNYYNVAAEAYEKTIDINRSKRSVWLGYAKMLYVKGMVIKAIEILEAAMTQFTNDALILFRLTGYYLDIGDFESAEYYLKEALKYDKKNLSYLYKTYPHALEIENIRKIINHDL